MTPIASQKVAAPGYAEAELILECRKIYWGDIDPQHFLAADIHQNYQLKDYHRFYFGEILHLWGGSLLSESLNDRVQNDQKALRPWKTLSKKTILDHGKFLKVEEHRIELPDGRIIPDWTWVIIPDAVIVLARTVDKHFLIFRQTKYALGISLAPVGGMLEAGEEPLAAAKRELMEEMGCEAAEWVPLGCYVLDPNRGVAKIYYFLALDARRVTEPTVMTWRTRSCWRSHEMNWNKRYLPASLRKPPGQLLSP